jgi:hypothetical protein
MSPMNVRHTLARCLTTLRVYEPVLSAHDRAWPLARLCRERHGEWFAVWTRRISQCRWSRAVW